MVTLAQCTVLGTLRHGALEAKLPKWAAAQPGEEGHYRVGRPGQKPVAEKPLLFSLQLLAAPFLHLNTNLAH